MPSWNEKAHVTPTISVVMSACGRHAVRIPCPIPRSVTFTVKPGKCSCGAARPWPHQPECTTPGSLKPIRVSCSITGKAWEESEVADAWPADGDGSGSLDGLDWPVELAACRDRWALVKALVMGESSSAVTRLLRGAELDLFDVRDAVFAALADMALAEDVIARSCEAVERALVEPIEWDGPRPSQQCLARCVERLIEQVGVLP